MSVLLPAALNVNDFIIVINYMSIIFIYYNIFQSARWSAVWAAMPNK